MQLQRRQLDIATNATNSSKQQHNNRRGLTNQHRTTTLVKHHWNTAVVFAMQSHSQA